ncbi:MAG: DUF1800 family protein [Rhodobacteraceae bacterium]|nr:DUF1800 family protein [Paracoccaceae bacterium]
MRFSPELAEIRFGCGLSPQIAAPGSAAEMLEHLRQGDIMAQAFPIEPYDIFRERLIEDWQARKVARTSGNDDDRDAAIDRVKSIRRAARQDMFFYLGQAVLRCAHSDQPFRERLVLFWADHFTAYGKAGIKQYGGPTYVEEAIRPNISGRFSDLLIAVTTHPVMIQYLDQNRSSGPNAAATKRSKILKGLNENLAREVLELHTLGVGGPYTQQDVRQLAELFTGLSHSLQEGFLFRPRMAEPGHETVLGKQYGGDAPSLDAIHQVLRDLAAHPATARHIARKLAVHFVSDHPDAGLVEDLAEIYLQTDGDLMAVYSGLLDHPASWRTELQNVKPPFDFVASACRALAVQPDIQSNDSFNVALRALWVPLTIMGQTWLRPAGPNGFPEEDEAWVTPQGLAARMRWAMAAPEKLIDPLPDPRVFVEASLGAFASSQTHFAAQAAETRAEGVGLVLISPAFQRR